MINNQPSSLLSKLIVLTILWIAAQAAFFIIHYQVSLLIDSLVNSGIQSGLFTTKVLLPIILFFGIQILAYVLFIAWIWFITVENGELCRLSHRSTQVLGITLWLLACILLLTLNTYYFPHSFFAELWQQYFCTRKLNHVLLIFLLSIFILMTLFAYLNCFYNKTYRSLGSFFLLMAIGLWVLSVHEKIKPVANKTIFAARPNIILIGLDSFRPDFTSYFGSRFVKTPHIDAFLKSSSVFTEAYTPLARTFPTWVTILTGEHPKHHGVRENLANPLHMLNKDTLAKRLQAFGYETIYATDEKRFSNITADYGFDHVVGPGMGANDFILGSIYDFPLSNLLMKLPIARFLFPYQYANRAAAITYEPKQFLHLLDLTLQRRHHQPLFLAVHLCLTHWPYSWAHAKQNENTTNVEAYTESIERMDVLFDEFLHRLKQNGLLEKSIIVLLSDHGTALGLPGDRLVNKNNYRGDEFELIKKISFYKYYFAKENSLNFEHDYGIDTSYGQGTDVLSHQQYRVLLAFRGYQVPIPVQEVNDQHSLMDIAPTLLQWFKLPSLPREDGQSLIDHFRNQHVYHDSPLFIETGDKLGEIETDKIDVGKVIQKRIDVYSLDQKSGLLFMNEEAETSIVHNKQRAILWQDWILARLPAQLKSKLAPDPANKDHLLLQYDLGKPSYILLNKRTGEWTLDLSLPFAKQAPLASLFNALQDFYQEELNA